MGAQQDRFIGGTQLIALRVAQHLGKKRVLLKQAVRQIVQKQGGVVVHTKRLRVRAKRAIVAVPPTLAGRIDYRPDLPADRDQLTQRLPQGNLTKVTAVYDRPFWRDAGLNGTAISTDGFVNATFDDTPPGGSPGVVFGFVGGDKSRSFNQLSPADRKAAVLAQFAQFFGSPANNPIDYLESAWGRREMVPRMPRRDSRPGGADGVWPPRCALRSETSIGPARRPPRTGTATWTARFAPASGRPPRSWPRSRA